MGGGGIGSQMYRLLFILFDQFSAATKNVYLYKQHTECVCVCVFQLFLDREGSRVFASTALVVVQMVS